MYIGQMEAGRYELGKRFESGSGSEVFLARDRKENTLVILKYIRDPASEEAQILSELEQEGIVRLIDFWSAKEGLVLAEEFFPGISLKHYVRKRQMLSEKETIRIGMKTGAILQYLHSRKPPIIYRDLKPDNLMIDANGNLRLIDFGAAKKYVSRSDEDAVCIGTKGYAAPEQFRKNHGQSDTRTDLYGLGATMYFMLTGLDPEEEGGFPYPLEILRQDISAKLCGIVNKCLQKDPELRFQSTDQFLYDLKQCRKKGSFERKDP